MKKKYFRHGFIAGLIFFLFSSFSPVRNVFAADHHGCSYQEADRDGDGVPDRTDAFPDDPSRTGHESEEGHRV